MRVLFLTTVMALCFVTQEVCAQTVTVEQQRFFFRGALGIGYGTVWSETLIKEIDAIGTLRLSGLGAYGNFSIGMSLIPKRLAFHVDACALSLVSPSISIAGSPRIALVNADSTTTLSIIGGGTTVHLPWANVWASVVGGASILSVEIPVSRASSGMGAAVRAPTYGRTQVGWGLNLLAGRDFPIIYNWSLGVSAHVIVASLPDVPNAAGDVAQWYGIGGGVSLSLTDH
jgi:hypothetical protein